MADNIKRILELSQIIVGKAGAFETALPLPVLMPNKIMQMRRKIFARVIIEARTNARILRDAVEDFPDRAQLHGDRLISRAEQYVNILNTVQIHLDTFKKELPI